MARTTNSMALRLWDQLGDRYDNQQLSGNFAKIDAHDHTPGRGAQIPTAGIAAKAITAPLLADSLTAQVIPGAWVPLTLGASVITGPTSSLYGYAASSRLLVDTVTLKGCLVNGGGGTIALNSTLATLPVGMRPNPPIGAAISLPVAYPGVGVGQIAITSDGRIVFSVALPAGYYIVLDGCSFTTS